jgi:hypothetical protein
VIVHRDNSPVAPQALPCQQVRNAFCKFSCLLTYTIIGIGILDTAAAGDVPTLINYQGRLVDANGVPLETANRDLSLQIFDAPAGGTPVYGPQSMPSTPIVNGYYNVLLGPVDEANPARPIEAAFLGAERYLEVRVNGTPMSPRQRILSAPYAIQALNAKNADSASGVVAGGITTAMLADDAVGSAQIQAGAIGPNEIAVAAVTTTAIAEDAVDSAKIAVGAVGSSEIADTSIQSQDFAVGAKAPLAAHADSADHADDAVHVTGQPNIVASNNVALVESTDGSLVTVPYAPKQITTQGGPVLIQIVSGSTMAGSYIETDVAGNPDYEVRIYREDAFIAGSKTLIARQRFDNLPQPSRMASSCITHIDMGPDWNGLQPGTYNYIIEIGRCKMGQTRLVLLEIGGYK